jgi:ribosomal-protein-alanine N-acetyltransferase
MSVSGIQVRLASAADLDAVVALERATAGAPHWPDAEYAAILLADVSTVRRCLFVAERAGRVIGFAVGKLIGSLAELESVAVGVEARRSGAGRTLCITVIDWCRAQGAEAVELEVRASSAGAIALYAGLGFVGVGRRPKYYSGPEDDAVLMRLELAGCG